MYLAPSVKIAHYDFLIQQMGAVMESAEVHGMCDKSGQVIYIDTGATNAIQKDTLLHEIMHAIWWTAYLEDEDKEERVVSSLSTGLLQVLRDNPWVGEAIR
jgi:hypothetical protein